MIPELAIMIGAYIVTRMIESLLGSSGRWAILARISAVVTIVIALVVVADMLLRGTTGLNVSELP
jgi:hypothetical protein